MELNKDNECCTESLDLFSMPAHQLAVEHFYDSVLLPIHPLSNASGVILFEASLSDCYTDLDQTELHVKVRIKKGDNTNIDAFVAGAAAVGQAAAVQPNSVGFVQNALQSMFSGLDIKLNGISTNSNFYTNGYIAYI